MSDRLIETLASALPVDPDDGTMPIEYFAIDDRDGYGLVREWSVPETVAEKQLAALTDAGLVVIDTRDEATVERLAEGMFYDERRRLDYESELGWDFLEMVHEHWRERARAVLALLAKGDE